MAARFGRLVGLPLTVLLLMVVTAVPAQATLIHLDCKVVGRENSYFQPTGISLDLDTDTKVARVNDDLVAKTGKATAKGKIETFNEQRLTVTWSLREVARDPKFSYSLTTANVLYQRLTVRTGGDGTLVSTTAGQSNNNMREFRAALKCTVRG